MPPPSQASAPTATWTWNDGVPQSVGYTLYAFIPRNYGTITDASYKIYGGAAGTTAKGTATVNQNSLSDIWTALGGTTYSFTKGDITKITSSGYSATAGKYFAVDIIRRWYKNDTKLTK